MSSLSALSKSQKGLVEQFKSTCSATDAQALKFLRAGSWDLAASINAFFESGEVGLGASSASSSSSEAAKEFKRFESAAEKGTIQSDGLERLAAEVGVDLYSHPAVLALMQKAGAATQGVLTEKEFGRLLTATGAKNVAALRAKVPELAADAGREPAWSFAYAFSCAEGQRSVEKDVAGALLGMLAPDWPLLPQFLAYLGGQPRTLTKDTWSLLLPFTKKFRSVGDLTTAWSDGDGACARGVGGRNGSEGRGGGAGGERGGDGRGGWGRAAEDALRPPPPRRLLSSRPRLATPLARRGPTRERRTAVARSPPPPSPLPPLCSAHGVALPPCSVAAPARRLSRRVAQGRAQGRQGRKVSRAAWRAWA